MWSDTVTRYRLKNGKVETQTYNFAHYEWEMENADSARGGAAECVGRLFLLGPQDIQAGDRVAPGKARNLPWSQLLPGKVRGLMVVDYVKQWDLDGFVHHTEAGRRRGPESR